MPPPATKPPPALARAVANKRYSGENFLQKIYRKYVKFEFIKYLVFEPSALPIVSVFILLAELFLNVFVINRVPYTEIDWKAYMQECEGFLNGTTNYALLKEEECKLGWKSARDCKRYYRIKQKKFPHLNFDTYELSEEMSFIMDTEADATMQSREERQSTSSWDMQTDIKQEYDDSNSCSRRLSENEKIKIIMEVERHPIIWDQSHPNHTNRNAYRTAWMLVSEETGISGDTGPLVYPAAFVYIYSALYYITSHGQNIRLAQYVFGIIYLLQMWLVLRLYTKSRKVPPYVLVISAFTSYRIHSIYVLRLFNDPVAILFLYAALNLFLDRHWTFGSICFSLGVGCKMNILLFAPALLGFYLINLGFMKTVLQLAVCGILQLLLGLPFLLTHPWQYIKGSFDLGRIFEHKWTVNYRFLPRELFENKYFHLSLLGLHLLLLLIFAKPAIMYFKNYARLRQLQDQFQPQLDQQNKKIKESKTKKSKKSIATSKKSPQNETAEEKMSSEQEAFLNSFEKGLQKSTGLKAPIKTTEKSTATQQPEDKVSIHFDQSTQLALLPFFLCNFIGVLCSRSLHYQFYVWYFHSLPYLTWSTDYSLGLRFLILGFIEFAWNTYPSTYFSCIVLHLCHLILLTGLGRNMFNTMNQSNAIRKLKDMSKVQQEFLNGSIPNTKTKKH